MLGSDRNARPSDSQNRRRNTDRDDGRRLNHHSNNSVVTSNIGRAPPAPRLCPEFPKVSQWVIPRCICQSHLNFRTFRASKQATNLIEEETILRTREAFLNRVAPTTTIQCHMSTVTRAEDPGVRNHLTKTTLTLEVTRKETVDLSVGQDPPEHLMAVAAAWIEVQLSPNPVFHCQFQPIHRQRLEGNHLREHQTGEPKDGEVQQHPDLCQTELLTRLEDQERKGHNQRLRRIQPEPSLEKDLSNLLLITELVLWRDSVRNSRSRIDWAVKDLVKMLQYLMGKQISQRDEKRFLTFTLVFTEHQRMVSQKVKRLELNWNALTATRHRNPLA